MKREDQLAAAKALVCWMESQKIRPDEAIPILALCLQGAIDLTAQKTNQTREQVLSKIEIFKRSMKRLQGGEK